MKCARSFGALVPMRYKPFNAPIPEKFEPSDYHLKELKKAKRRLAEIQSWDDAKAREEAEKAYMKAVHSRNERIAQENAIRQRYENMLVNVIAWTPPTPDHKGLKQFMIDQLKNSIEYDCKDFSDEPQQLSGAEYKQQQMEKVRNDIDYHEKEYEEEVRRTKERNNWLNALRKSLSLY